MLSRGNVSTTYENNWFRDNERISETLVDELTLFLGISVVYTLLDFVLSLALWSAASVGTPTEPRGRDGALRGLIWSKITFMNLLLAVALAGGIWFVNEGRNTNYGCGGEEEYEAITERFEQSPWYRMFCVVMFTYAFELLLLPAMALNQIGKSITLVTNRNIFAKTERNKNIAACLGGCFRCLQCLSCYQVGGAKIRAQADLKDAAVWFMDYFNHDTNFDLVMSDIYLAFKMLKRVQRERKYIKSEQVRMDKERLNGEGRGVDLDKENASNDEGHENSFGMLLFLSCLPFPAGIVSGILTRSKQLSPPKSCSSLPPRIHFANNARSRRAPRPRNPC